MEKLKGGEQVHLMVNSGSTERRIERGLLTL
ncbi:hypothetical protein V6Z12_D07G153900 [Gossypium hirsutum]